MSLTTQELAQIRNDIELLFPDTCNILSLTRTSDGQGGWSEAWGTATANVSCRIDYETGRESVNADSLKPYQAAYVSIPYDTTVTTANRIEINSIAHTVHSVNINQSWIGVKRAKVEKV